MVNINQLFLKKPPQELARRLLKHLGITSFRDKKEITQDTMIANKTIEKMQKEIPILKNFYLPCKSKLFLDNLNLKKCITITRQILKLYDYDIVSIERSVNTKKTLFYHLVSKIEKERLSTKKTSNSPRKEYIIVFN